MRRSWCEPSAKPCSTSSAGARPPARADRESARSVRHRRGLAEQRVIREIMLFLHSNGVGTSRAATSLERREVPMQLNPLSSWHWLPSGHGPKASIHRNLTKADLRQRQCLPNGPGEKSATPATCLVAAWCRKQSCPRPPLGSTLAVHTSRDIANPVMKRRPSGTYPDGSRAPRHTIQRNS
jgi:hypothetical protein